MDGMINVDNLDLAYSQTESLFETESKNGVELLNSLDELIAHLKEHWIGADGTMHINRLVDIHDRLQSYLQKTLEDTQESMDNVIKIQEVRRSNGGGGQVGDLKKIGTDFIKSIEKVENTEKYYIDPKIKDDYSELGQVEEKLKTFNSNFKVGKNALMDNWISGSNKEKVKNNFDEIETIAAEAEKVIAEVKNELNTSINNANQIM